MSDVSERMRSDWNERAKEDAYYYVAFGSRDQDEKGFLETGSAVLSVLELELKRFPRDANRRAWRALEIGCGPGRLMKPMSRHFGEIHGVDVSDEMIRLARERLSGIPHAHVHATDGASLSRFADDSFDFVYSYAVFQHIPSRDVVLEYMREIFRVLKPGGVFRGQFNGLPQLEVTDTWAGVRFSREEIQEFTTEHGLQLLHLEGAMTQYMWTSWRKPERVAHGPEGSVTIRRITNAYTSEPLVPNRGQYAAMTIWVMNLPVECDLNSLEVRIGGTPGTPVYVGVPEADGLQQINVMLPDGVRTGLVPIEIFHNGERLGTPALARIFPAGPLVPRVLGVTDGVNIIHHNRTITGTMKVQLEEVPRPELISIYVDGQPVRNVETFCSDPLPPRYELNFTMPEGITPGTHELRIRVGERDLLPIEIECATR